MATKKKYWFKSRESGWGWGMPATWQGWASYALFFLVWVWAVANLMPSAEDETGNIKMFVVVLLINIAALVLISFKFGDAPAWAGGSVKPTKKPAAAWSITSNSPTHAKESTPSSPNAPPSGKTDDGSRSEVECGWRWAKCGLNNGIELG